MSAFDVRDLLDAAGPSGAAAPAEAPAPPQPSLLSPVVLSGCVRTLDVLLMALVGLVAHRIALKGAAPLGLAHICAVVGVAGLAVGALQVGRAYRIGVLRSLPATAIRLVLGWSFALALVAAAMVVTKVADDSVRLWLAGFYVAGLAALLAARLALLVFLRAKIREGVFERRTAIVGGGPAAEELIQALEASGDASIRIVGVFDDRDDDRSSLVVAGHPKLGNVSDLVAYARRARLDLIVFTVPISAEARILQMLAKLWVLPIDIRLSAHATKLRLRPRAYSYLGKVPVLDVFDKPLADWDVIVKGVFDRTVALVALLALSLPMIGVALAVKLTSRGPVLFRQKRYGFNNELIEVFKFRSMYVDQGDAAASRLVTRDDPRVTPVGRFIRKTSLDELPQLFNVLKGDLSLVGPRPHALQAKAANTLYDQVVDGYFARHKVKPGITGWAQINGWRGETDTSEKIQKRVEHDLYYIENWSILLDIRILANTPLSLFKTENAY